MDYVVAYIAAGIAFLIIDIIWLGMLAKGFYKSQIGDLLTGEVNFVAAAGFYVLYLLGVVVFAVAPALASGELLEVVWRGALFGLVAYATYDLTNMATLRGWTVTMTVVDMIWGVVLTTGTAVASFVVTRFFFPG